MENVSNYGAFLKNLPKKCNKTIQSVPKKGDLGSLCFIPKTRAFKHKSSFFIQPVDCCVS